MKPADAEPALERARAHHRAGRLEDAERLYAEVLKARPDDVDGLFSHGVLAFQTGRYADAAARFQRAAALRPGFARAHNHAGLALKRLGRLDEAAAAFREAAAADPKDPREAAQAHANLGSVRQDQGRLDEAIGAYREALRLRPDLVEAHNNLGTALRQQGRLDEALAAYRDAVRLAPQTATIHNNLGNVLGDLRRHDEAIAAFRAALRLHPGYAEAYGNLGVALRNVGRAEEAAAALGKAIEIDPGLLVAHRTLAGVLAQVGPPGEAVAAWRRAVERAPDDAESLASLIYEQRKVCRWEGLDALWRRLCDRLDAGATMPPLAIVAPETSPDRQLASARAYARERFGRYRSLPPAPSTAKARITVGYLSADFGEHPVGRLMAGVVERHDRARFEVVGYALGDPYPGPMRQRFAQAFDRFTDVGALDPMRAAERIRADGVDVLVDLMGYTTDSRTEILALRPSPVQVSYLGYLGTMGTDFIDYMVADAFVVPPDLQPFFTERLVHLPDCYQVRADPPPSPDGPDRAACGLPEDGVVFCCFNHSHKIRPEVFDVWMRLIERVPDSVLWLAAPSPLAADNLRSEARARGADPARLAFAPTLPYPEHLARVRNADLFLDTTPYNAGATALDALVSGCPVVTCAGDTYISRMAGSQLRAAGLADLVTGSLAEYEALALGLATDPGALAAVRARLDAARATAPLFDGGRFTRHLEAAYARMWARYRAGEPPAPIAVPAD